MSCFLVLCLQETEILSAVLLTDISPNYFKLTVCNNVGNLTIFIPKSITISSYCNIITFLG